ncbi:MAG: (2Fe-2S) ferredoxin domain-containing protein [Phycisphaerae bacterium]|jgi:NADP-reducing hydrogenase subunit HndB|nr:(2Fe-2S) ferredoxin domain-containing protein [Phycisphaerae bacterium]
MAKIKPEDLAKIQESMSKTMSLRDGEARARITVHMGTCGIAAGARKLMSTLMASLDERPEKDIILSASGCAGLCSREPMMTVELEGQAPVKYVDLDETKANRILEDHVLSGTVVEEYALAVGSERRG